MDFETDKIDGRTILTNTGHPIIFINANASGDRQRLTLAHEIGHLILHLGNMPLFGRDEEAEAWNFGMEFLMPIAEVKYDFNNSINLEKLADLKRVWKVSMQSILYRIQDKGLATYNQCRYLWSQFSTRGWKKAEPIEIPKETPTLISRMVNMFISDLGYTKDEMANILNVEKEEFENRYLTVKGKLRVA
jgi:Zn-dependent peptidase ImmA (M78 family)